jgi:hypothetical protein
MDMLISTCGVAEIEAEVMSLRQRRVERESAASAATPPPNLAAIPSPRSNPALRL